MSVLLEYECPCCGGNVEFDSSLQKMKCPYCDTVFDMEALEEHNRVLKAAQDAPQEQLHWQPEQQQWEKRRLAVAGVLTLVLAVLWFWLEPIVKEFKTTTYDTVPQVLLHILVFDPMLMLVGWTGLQACHVYLGAKRLKEEKRRWFRRGTLILLGVWCLLILPMLVDLVRMDVSRWMWVTAENFTSYSSADHALPEPWYSIVWNPVSSGLLWGNLKLWGLFPFLGASLWLGGFPKGGKTDA